MSLLPSSKKQRGSNAHTHAPKQERRLAKTLGGRVTAASGALDEKGDVRLKGIARIEAKCTSNKSFSVDRNMIQKIENASVGHGEVPIIQIEFLGERGQVIDSVALMPMKHLEMLLDGKDE